MPNNYIQTLTVDGTTYDLKDNISGYVTTDEKLKVDGAADDTMYYPVLSTYDTTASTKHVSPGLSYSSSSQGEAYLTIGNNDLVGKLLIGAASGSPYRTVIQPSTLTANQYITLPDASGTVALTNKTFGISGDAREGSCLYVGDSSPYTANLQLKRKNASMLNLAVRDDGYLQLQSVPYVDGEDDWSNTSTIWTKDMKRLRHIGYDGTINWAFKATAANTWQYTGKSFTVPSGYLYLANIYLGFSSGNPTGMGIHTASSGTPRWRQEATGIQQSPTWTLGAGTYYIFERRASVPSTANTLYMGYIVIDLT